MLDGKRKEEKKCPYWQIKKRAEKIVDVKKKAIKKSFVSKKKPKCQKKRPKNSFMSRKKAKKSHLCQKSQKMFFM